MDRLTGLSERGVCFLSLQEAINTTTSSSKLGFHGFGALAEFRRASVDQTTRATRLSIPSEVRP
jgi:DNA invertase Pin-like site-specific DNA recombinase